MSPITVTADATGFNADNVDFAAFPVDCVAGTGLGPADSSGTSAGTFSGTGSPFGPVTLTVSAPISIPTWCWDIQSQARQNCSKATALSNKIRITADTSFCPVPAGANRVTLSSELTLAGGRLQVVVNGTSAAYPGPGRSLQVAEGRAGENRIEATVVEGGQAGTWRLELPSSGVKAGSVRVLAGEASVITDLGAVVKLKGTPGERVVITFVRE